MIRPSFHKTYLDFAKNISKRSTCLSRQVGAIIVRNNVILSTGYNGAPAKVPHCSDCGGCLRRKLNVPSGTRHELCRGAHAEQNAINNAAKEGININGSTLYCTTYPCSMCAKSIINSGIRKIYYVEGYSDDLTKELFSHTEIELIQFSEIE